MKKDSLSDGWFYDGGNLFTPRNCNDDGSIL